MNVISFSLWGDDAAFFNGALENVRLAKTLYPDWTCFCFISLKSPKEWSLALDEAGAQIHFRPIHKGDWEGLFWRFEPIFDPFVDRTIVRDCDSRVNPREVAAVNEWLRSGKSFHVMRDHYEHNVPIMGGMFGSAQWYRFGELMSQWTDYSAKGCDQKFLGELIWPAAMSSVIAHDRYAQGLSMPNRGGVGTYEYRPLEQFGFHDLRNFPDHPPMDATIYGEHVGARVGI